jgi:hypothetical protein
MLSMQTRTEEIEVENTESSDAGLSVLRWWQVGLVIAGLSGIALLPALFCGAPDGQDFDYHLQHWIEVAGQWRSGVWFPRWSSLSAYGYGEPSFIFYPPISWILGAFLVSIVPLNSATCVFSFLVLTLAGLSMFALARHTLAAPHALVAAAFYLVNPYMLLCMYQRSAFAEMVVGALFPLVLLFALRLRESPTAVAPLAITFAACWLSNLPAAVVVTYALTVILVVLAFVYRSWRTAAYGAAAMLLGFGLAAFFLIPAAYEQRWVQIQQAIAPWARPETMKYSFAWRPDTHWFSALVAAIAYIEIAIAGLSLILSWSRRQAHRGVLWVVSILVCTASLMTLPAVTGFVWTHLPELEYVQFPWRWLFVLNTCLTLLLAFSLGHLRVHWFAAVALLIALVGGVSSGWSASWIRQAATDIADEMHDQRGYDITDEYLPRDAERRRVMQLSAQAAQAVAVGDVPASLRVLCWSPERRIIEVDASATTHIALRLLAYPAWRVKVNGNQAEMRTGDAGQLVIPVPAGRSYVEVNFLPTSDWILGALVSSFAMVIAGIIVWRGRALRDGRT